jgi:hypothetical protein
LAGARLPAFEQKRIVEFNLTAAAGALLEMRYKAFWVVLAKPWIGRNPRPHTLRGFSLATARPVIAVVGHHLEGRLKVVLVVPEHLLQP